MLEIVLFEIREEKIIFNYFGEVV